MHTVMPEFVNAQGYPVLPLEKFVDYPINMVGIGGPHTSLCICDHVTSGERGGGI